MDDQRPADDGGVDHAPASSANRYILILTRLLVTLAVIAVFACWVKIVHPHEMIGFLGMMIAFCALIVSWCSRGPIIGAVAGAALLPATACLFAICFEISKLFYFAAVKIISLF